MRLASSVIVLAQLANAEPPGLSRPVEPAVDSYRLETDALDALAVALATSTNTDGPPDYLAVAGMLLYLVGPPLVHVAHGRGARGALSFGMRLGMRYGAAVLGALHDRSHGGSTGTAVGTVLGIAGAMALDTIYLARGDEPSVVPVVTPSGRGLALGIAGWF
jgi:hypothetical protein